MKKKFNEDCIVYSPEVKAQMESNPEIAEAMRSTAAVMRQAHHAWQEGKYDTFDDAMFAITGQRPERVEED